MAVEARPKLEQLARFVASQLHEDEIVREAWVSFDGDEFSVQVLVDTEDLDAEQQIRSIYRPLLDAFPTLLIDLHVTNLQRMSEDAWKSTVDPSACRIEL
jgi:hypothetical protein